MTINQTERASVVLVHGAYADGSSWSDVIELLQDEGVHVTAVQNSLDSLERDVAETVRVLELHDGPVVLAGHSWAGTVISEAGEHPSVKALVYIAARAPDAGEDYAALASGFAAPPASKGLVFCNGFGQLSENAFREHFANGVEPRRAGALFAAQGRISEGLFGSRTTMAAWRVRPCWYAVSARDGTTSPDLERFLARRMDARTIEIDSGHLSMITHPKQVAELILEAVRSLGSNETKTSV